MNRDWVFLRGSAPARTRRSADSARRQSPHDFRTRARRRPPDAEPGLDAAGPAGDRPADAHRLQRLALSHLPQPGRRLRRLGRLPAGARRRAAADGMARGAGQHRAARVAGHPRAGGARRLGVRVGAVVAVAVVGGRDRQRDADRRGRRLGSSLRPCGAGFPRLLHRPRRGRRVQQRDRPGAGVRALLARRHLGRRLGDPRPRHRQPAPAQPPEQPAAVVDRRGGVARRSQGWCGARRRRCWRWCSSTSWC